MISKAKAKWLHSLEYKKFRNEYGCFIAEGHKSVGDLLPLLSCRFLAATQAWMMKNQSWIASHHHCEIVEVNEEELTGLSLLHAPQEVLAVFDIPQYTYRLEDIRQQLCLAVDNIQDPGNFGTIIRTADWFGIEDIFCSIGTVDAYHPKCVQASMGAIGRIRIHYVDLPVFLQHIGSPIYGTFLDGDNIYEAALSDNGIIVMGNEGNGVSSEAAACADRRLLIPNFPASRACSESLNVSTATAIVCSEFRRRCR